MIYTSDQLKTRARERPAGYAAEVLFASKDLGGGRWYLSEPARMRLAAKYRPMGLGDLVEWVAKPIARWIDARQGHDPVLGWLVNRAVRAGWVTLPLAGCSACSGRRRRLNRWMPDVRSWRAWVGVLQALFRRLANPRKAP